VSVLVAGVDEAGLGPILGPLCFGWVVLRLPAAEADPWELLSEAVTREPAQDRERLVVADSKQVHGRHPRGRRRLEATVLAALGAAAGAGAVPSDPRRLIGGPLGPSEACLAAHPWYSALPATLPLWWDRGALELRAERLRRVLRQTGVELVDLGVRAVPAGELNRSFAATGNKATSTWNLLLEVLQYLWRRGEGHELRLLVDRQGGRAHYGPLLARGLPGSKVSLVSETEGRSEYLARRERGSLQIAFAERAEQASFAVALASCLAKYTRELAMEAFNAWFGARVPGLAPTAGYATDGRRWLAQAEPVLRTLPGLDRALLVRER
jgi:hypothetical protein